MNQYLPLITALEIKNKKGENNICLLLSKSTSASMFLFFKQIQPSNHLLMLFTRRTVLSVNFGNEMKTCFANPKSVGHANAIGR